MTTRYDVSAVPLQGGYVAKQCPVRAQNDALAPAEPMPTPPMLDRLFQRGNAFEAEVVAAILALHPGAAVIQAEDAAARELATVEAMRAGLSPILNARLPVDLAGRRLGKPDLLVVAPGGGYRVVDVKHHLSLEPKRNAAQLPGLCSSLGDPGFEAALVDEEFSARKSSGDLLQLAHYQRMLEAAGFAAPGGRWAGIVGKEQRIVWYDLDAPIWRTPSLSETTKCRSTMERYDFEFDFRLDIIAVAERHRVDPDTDLLVLPVRCTECPSCPWWDYCRPQLEAGSGDVSLLPGVGWSQWKRHHDRGVTDRAALAALDLPTARLVATNVDVASLQTAASGLPADALIETVVDDPSGRLTGLLQASGVTTVGELRALDAVTALYAGSGLSGLPEQIDLARAAIASEPAFRRRGLTGVSVPRAAIEVDVDMENVEDGCYLWGTLVSDRAGSGLAPSGYRSFAAPWVPLTAEAEAENSLRFWRWLMGLRASAHDAGLTFRAYCYHANAENQYLRRLGIAGAISDEVAAFIGSDEWVDMLMVFESQFLTGRASGLKVVAPLVGFHWDVDDAGGAESMVAYDAAVGASTLEEREVARDWLLRYNRGDVEATLHLREWIDHEGRLAPAIESLDPRGWS